MSQPQPKAFYWYDGKEVLGPISGVEVRELALQGKIVPQTQIQVEGHDKWVEARRLKGLFDAQGNVLPHPAGEEGTGDVPEAEGPPRAAPGVTESPPAATPLPTGSAAATPPAAVVPPALPVKTTPAPAPAPTPAAHPVTAPVVAPAVGPAAGAAGPVVTPTVTTPEVKARPMRRRHLSSDAARMTPPGSFAASLIDWTRGLYYLVGGAGGAWRSATFLWAATTFAALPYLALQTITLLWAFLRVKREIPRELEGLMGGSASTLGMLTPVLLLAAGVVCLIFGHFILQRMAAVGDQVVSFSYKISTTAPYDCAAAVAVLFGLLSFGSGVWMLVLEVPLTISGVFIVLGPALLVVASHLLNLDEIGLVVDSRCHLSDDMLGFIAFLLKVGFLALPSFVGLFCVLATAAYVLGTVGTLITLLGSRDATLIMLAQAPYTLWVPLMCLAVLPLGAFVMAAAYSLLLDLARSVLDLGKQARKGE